MNIWMILCILSLLILPLALAGFMFCYFNRKYRKYRWYCIIAFLIGMFLLNLSSGYVESTLLEENGDTTQILAEDPADDAQAGN